MQDCDLLPDLARETAGDSEVFDALPAIRSGSLVSWCMSMTWAKGRNRCSAASATVRLRRRSIESRKNNATPPKLKSLTADSVTASQSKECRSAMSDPASWNATSPPAAEALPG